MRVDDEDEKLLVERQAKGGRAGGELRAVRPRARFDAVGEGAGGVGEFAQAAHAQCAENGRVQAFLGEERVGEGDERQQGQGTEAFHVSFSVRTGRRNR